MHIKDKKPPKQFRSQRQSAMLAKEDRESQEKLLSAKQMREQKDKREREDRAIKCIDTSQRQIRGFNASPTPRATIFDKPPTSTFSTSSGNLKPRDLEEATISFPSRGSFLESPPTNKRRSTSTIGTHKIFAEEEELEDDSETKSLVASAGVIVIKVTRY